MGPPRRPAEPSPVTPGTGRFSFADDRGTGGGSLTVLYHRPPNLPETAPIIFVMHGTRRDAYHYRDTWRAAAERFGFILLCPEFSRTSYPRRAYHLGNLIDGAGQPLPQDEWGFGVIERLFDFVREATGNESERYGIYGHSAGGQFVHRLVLFMPTARFAAAVAANTGWYTMPAFGRKFPYGLKDSPGTPEKLKEALGRRLVIQLGERDTDADDPTLRNTARARKQGRNRFERGHAFFATARDQAADLGVPLNWRLETVPDAAHSDALMMPAASRTLLAKLPAGELGSNRRENRSPEQPGHQPKS